jgi:DNA mismatch repair protein MutL
MPIRFLSPEDAQKVAAGEVVERPANIIKELVENSIDAQATHIEISVKQGGKTYIRITDNGTGMSEEDARLCFERYATSKLSCFDDLQHIATFGFRGEALASVCGVAKVTLTTKQQGEIEGLQLTIQEGKILSQKTVAAPVGTTFIVDDLFYNIPARRKFLKTTATEWNQIVAIFKAFCLTYPTLHFVLLHDHAQVYNCPPVATVQDRVGQLFDPSIFSSTLELSPEQDIRRRQGYDGLRAPKGTLEETGIAVTGVTTNPHYSRYDRSGLYFFVNKRLVKNYQLARAVLKGFCNVLPANKYPLAVIHLEIDPLTVDVNIHPKKEEVLFLHPHLVEQAITKAITTTLEQYMSQRLTPTHKANPQYVSESFFTPNNPTLNPFFERTHAPQPYNFQAQPFSKDAYSTELSLEMPHHPTPALTIPDEVFEDGNLNTIEEMSYRIIGQLHKTYLLLEHKDGMLVIDQHAAHERILYERFGKNFGKTETIQLLFPLIVTLSSADLALLMPYTSLLQDQGITCEQFGEEQLRITAVPVYAKQIPLQELVQELVGWIKENDSSAFAQGSSVTGTLSPDFFKILTEKMRAQLACKAAVKAGDVLTMEAMEQLLRDLEKTKRRFSCPHGRPTQWLISTSEIERKFKRIV